MESVAGNNIQAGKKFYAVKQQAKLLWLYDMSGRKALVNRVWENKK